MAFFNWRVFTFSPSWFLLHFMTLASTACLPFELVFNSHRIIMLRKMSSCSHLNVDNCILYSFSYVWDWTLAFSTKVWFWSLGLNNWFWICIFRLASMRQCLVSLTKITFTASNFYPNKFRSSNVRFEILYPNFYSQALLYCDMQMAKRY